MSLSSLHPARRTRAPRALARLTIAALVGSPLALLAASPADAVVSTTGDPAALAASIAGPGANVTGAAFTEVPAGGTPHAVSTTPLAGLPTDGSSFAVLTTGNAALADDPNAAPNSGADLGDTSPRGGSVRDASVLRIDLNVPATANCLSFDFTFLSEEYPEFVGGAYNDAFIAELDTSTWSTSGNDISAPDNFAFDAAHNVVSVNAVGLGGFSAANAVGTTYDGATPRLSAARQVSPGAHSLYLSIFDMGDGIYDSAAFVDNLRVGFVPDPATQCTPGAAVKQFQLDLAPPTATHETGASHTVTATLKDLNASPSELAGGTVLFSAAGANTASGSDVTDAGGHATFTYTGTNVGDDTISACYDQDGNGTCGPDEPFASAQATWTNAPPTNDAGGPYTGDEGGPVALAGTAADSNGDTLANTWTAAPVSGVDTGASCSFGDPTSLTTSVTCTDDGVWELTLTTDDGHNPPVSDTATLTLGNRAPTIGSVTATSAPVPVGAATTVSATYADAGSNDTHTASVDWGDGSSSAGTATAGAVTGSHAYTAAGTYAVCVTVTDDDGGSATKCAPTYVVIVDAGAGFVTGGGWFDSTLGKATFGLVAKYQGGATTPTGNTEFQVRGINFHATSLDWLVVSGDRATYQGAGTVNGAPGYSFLVAVRDGGSPGSGADRFRIRIWKAGTVVFDNQPAAPDTAAPTTPINQGSIVIHG